MKEKGRKAPLHPRGPGKNAPAEAPSAAPTYDEIAQRAYEIYLARGGGPGREDEDWRQAERELREAREKA
jgi:hypothetical protein